MRFPLKTLFTVMALSASVASQAEDQLPPKLPTQQDNRLEQVATSPKVWNGVTVSQDGRIFVSLTQSEGPGTQLAEVINHDQLKPYPDESWNQWNSADPQHHFYHVNALRIGPDGNLWAMDSGNKGIGTGSKSVEGAAKLVKIDLSTNKVVASYVLHPPVLKPESYIDDVRFNGDFAYLSDPGAVGIVVLNLKTGKSWRVLENQPLTIDHQPIYADGKKLYLPSGKEKRVGVDQLEVSQTANGSISKPFQARWHGLRPVIWITQHCQPLMSTSMRINSWIRGVPEALLSTVRVTSMPLT